MFAPERACAAGCACCFALCLSCAVGMGIDVCCTGVCSLCCVACHQIWTGRQQGYMLKEKAKNDQKMIIGKKMIKQHPEAAPTKRHGRRSLRNWQPECVSVLSAVPVWPRTRLLHTVWHPLVSCVLRHYAAAATLLVRFAAI